MVTNTILRLSDRARVLSCTCAGLSLTLATFAILRHPVAFSAEGRLLFVLIATALAGHFSFSMLAPMATERKAPVAFRMGIHAGLLIGLLLTIQILVPYLIVRTTSENRSISGVPIFIRWCCFVLASLAAAWQTGRFRHGAIADL